MEIKLSGQEISKINNFQKTPPFTASGSFLASSQLMLEYGMALFFPNLTSSGNLQCVDGKCWLYCESSPLPNLMIWCLAGWLPQSRKTSQGIAMPGLSALWLPVSGSIILSGRHWCERVVSWVTCFSTRCKLVYALKFADLLTSIGKMSDYIDWSNEGLSEVKCISDAS